MPRGPSRHPATPGDRPGPRPESPMTTPNLKRILFAAAVALSVGVAIVAVGEGFSSSFLIRLVEAGAGAVVATRGFGGPVVVVAPRPAAWRGPGAEGRLQPPGRPPPRPAPGGPAPPPP